MTDAGVQPIEPQDIAAVEAFQWTDTVNKFLAAGWVITAIVKNQSGPESVSVDYHMAWPRQLGKPKYPETFETRMRRGKAFSSDAEVPF
ncbi:hypothetical protein GTP56_03400 [Duganella sp. FT134W]|uniref:Uncharacterized protein n=1 Tax=Duganella margarita TaxID=2692170 RepID=A0A7X4GXW7_9BURK|nr:hypothetical protein [Duganella margarita]MYM71240.1 hypothetical protein [Duganella margarita]